MHITLTLSHLRYVVAAVALSAVGLSAYDAHHVRKILDDSVAASAAQAARNEAAAKEPQVCTKAMSGLDHDVDLGVAAPCPNARDGLCLHVGGQVLTVAAAGARCAAGRL